MISILIFLILLVMFFVMKNHLDRIEKKIDTLASQHAVRRAMPQQAQRVKKDSAVSTEQQHNDEHVKTVAANAQQHVASAHAPDVSEYEKFYGASDQQHPTITTKQTQLSQQQSAPAQKTEPSILQKFLRWLRDDWPMKVGGLLVILSAGWFITYAADQGWIGEIGRVTLGYLFGLFVLAYGAFRAKTFRLQGNTFVVIGVVVIFIATLASDAYALQSAMSAMIVMFITVGFVALLALQQRNYPLALTIILFGAIVPLFFFTGIDISVMFVYLFALTLGTLWIVARSQWRSLTLVMLLIVIFYAVSYSIYGAITGAFDIETMQNMIIALLFSAVFYLANTATIVVSQIVKKIDAVIALGVGFLYVLFTLLFVPQTLQVFFPLFGLVMFSLASYVIFHYTKEKAPTVIYGGISFLLLVIATAFQFDAPVLVIAYIIEVTVFISLLIYISGRNITTLMRFGSVVIYFLTLLGVIQSLVRLFEVTHFLQYNRFPTQEVYPSPTAIAVPHLFVLCITGLSGFIIAGMIIKFVDTQIRENRVFMRIFAYIGGMAMLLLIWFIAHITMTSYDVASLVALSLYTIFGVILYVMGAKTNYGAYRILGAILFGIVLLRIFTVEFWDMSTPIRIITAFILGGLFISTAFIAQINKSHQ